MWADTVTFSYGDYKGQGTSSSGSEYTMVKSNVSIKDTKFYGNTSYAQFYAGGTTTITPGTGVTITQIELTASSTSYNGYQSSGTVTASNGSISGSTSSTTVTWTGSATSSFTISHSKQIRWTSIVVTYTVAAPAYTITAQSNNTSYGTVSLSGTVITGTPNSGYRYADPAYTVSPANSATVSQEGNAFTVTPSANTTVTINFEAIPCYTVTLSDDTENPMTEYSAGVGVTLPERSTLNGYEFAGWSETNVSTETTTAPSIIPAGTYYPTANITLYPVYTKTEVSSAAQDVTTSVTILDYASANNWSNGIQYTSVALNSDVTATASSGTNTGKYYTNGNDWRFYQGESATLTIATTNGTLKSATLTYTIANTGQLNYNSSAVTSETAVSLSGTSAEFAVGNSGTATNGQVKFTAISVTYTAAGTSTTYYWSSPVAAAVERPVISVADNFTFSTTASIDCETDGATIYYTLDGTDPTSSSTEYTAPFTINSTTTIKAIAIKGSDESEIASKTATKNLAVPTVTVSGDLTLDLDGGTNVSAGTLSAAVTYEDAAVAGATVTWSSSAPAVATIDASTGAVTLLTTGTVTFTATYAGNSNYAEATGTKAFTVVDSNAPGTTQQNPYTVAQALTAIQVLPNNNATSEKYYVSGIVSAFYGEATGITSASSKRYYISDDGTTTTQLLVYSGKGLNNVAFSSDDDLLIGDRVIIYGAIQNYQGNTPEIASGNYIVSLDRTKQDPTIPDYTDASRVFGNTYTVDDAAITGGAITVTSSNTAVATVSGLVITPVAVGTTTITVETAESNSYNAGSKTFTLTVTAPEGVTEAPSGSIYSNTTTFTDKDLNYSEGIDWTCNPTNAINSFESSGDARGVQFGAAKGEFTLTASTSEDITKVSIVLSTNGTGNTIGVSVGSTDFTTTYSDPDNAEDVLTLTSGMKNATVEFDGIGTGDIVISINDANKSVYIKTITISGTSSSAYTESVKLNGSGYATYCSQYPLDFTDAESDGYSAWQITGVSGSTITFSQITGSVKGGTGILLKGTADETVTLTSANSETTLNGNKLYGTLAPTYVAADQYYGLSGQTFVKVNAGTVKAGKALLPASEVPATVKAFNFVFEDEDATGIQTIDNGQQTTEGAIYNLAGQRLNKMQKGINIVNGKKILK